LESQVIRSIQEEKENTTVKLTHFCIVAVALFLVAAPLAQAQSGGFYIGGGSNFVKANGLGISAYDFVSTCNPNQDSYCYANPSLKGFFLGIGGDVMVNKRFGIGAEVSFQPSKDDYGPFQYRQLFFDVNGIFAPVDEKRVSLKLMGGIGLARTSLSYDSTDCISTIYCSSSSSSVGTSKHFQIHAGAAVEFMLTDTLMVRPQVDFRYIPNFTDIFGRNVVPGAMVWIGFKVKR
jgi:hypothetical protein